MDKYKVNNIFDDNALTLDELISSFFLSFLDEDLKFNDIIDMDIILDLCDETL